MRYFNLLAALVLLGLAAVPVFASGAHAPGTTATPVTASTVATDAFFEDSLGLAIDQLQGAPKEEAHLVSVTAGVLAPPTSPTALLSQIGQIGDPIPVEPTMAGTTCTSSTCSNFATCNGTATCTNTCNQYPTCLLASPSMCNSTCSSHPTCDLSEECKPTKAKWETCNGNGQPTQACNESCNTYPTCYTTCNGSGDTCGTKPTCDSWTCAGAVSCDGSLSCSDACITKDSVSSCQGQPPSYCQNTCSGYSTCAGFQTCKQGITCQGEGCSDYDGLALPLNGEGGDSYGLALIGLGTVLVTRRRKLKSND